MKSVVVALDAFLVGGSSSVKVVSACVQQFAPVLALVLNDDEAAGPYQEKG